MPNVPLMVEIGKDGPELEGIMARLCGDAKWCQKVVDFLTDRKPLQQGPDIDSLPHHPDLPEVARPEIPTFSQNAGGKEIISKIFDKTHGLFIGEEHENDAGVRFLIENMDSLAKDGKVKTIYAEGIDKDLNKDLDDYFKTGKMSEKLKKEVDDIDSSYKDRVGQYNTKDLLEKAREHGIRLRGTETKETQDDVDDGDAEARIRRFNKELSNQITEDQRDPDSGNYVALLGKAHTGNVSSPDIPGNQRYPGVDRMTGGISLDVDYVRKGEQPGITQGTTQTELEPNPDDPANPQRVHYHPDLRLRLQPTAN